MVAAVREPTGTLLLVRFICVRLPKSVVIVSAAWEYQRQVTLTTRSCGAALTHPESRDYHCSALAMSSIISRSRVFLYQNYETHLSDPDRIISVPSRQQHLWS
jgi:hypothetical protein